MNFERCAGILLHPTSLPGKFGIGDLGGEAYKFVDFLVAAGQVIWQVFPLGPTGYGDSPYQCFSAFAGNPLLISPENLAEESLLSQDDLNSYPELDPSNIDYGRVIGLKLFLLHKAYENFRLKKDLYTDEYNTFINENSEWLNDYSLFMASKDYHKGVTWTSWTPEIAFREEGSIEKWTNMLEDEINYYKFIQFIFFRQWMNLKQYANLKGIKIVGDLPIFIAYDSADLWANKELFTVDEHGKLLTCAGVPPDYFSPTGQLWGNPLYRWDVMEKDNFMWWQKRFKKLFAIADYVRIDHFRGFDAFYEIPGDALTAQTGRWVKAPGEKLFTVIKEVFGDVPIWAEDLGIITKSVVDLRDKFDFPGMKILQFSFGNDGEKKFLPHNYINNCVVFTGSHDNDTTKGFFDNAKVNTPEIYHWAQNYLNYYGDDMCKQLIKEAYKSIANFVIIPMQDMLNLGTEARMNFPGKLGGNWTWRFTWDKVNSDLANEYNWLVELYERNPRTKKPVEYAEIESEDYK